MGLGDLFRKKTKIQEGKDAWKREEVETYKEKMLELIPKMHKNFFEIKKIYDRAEEEGWKRNAWEKKNVSERPMSEGYRISFSPIGGWDNPKPGELERVKKRYSEFQKQKDIDIAFIYRCKNKQMMLFTKYISETEFEFFKNFPFENYKNYFENQKKFFEVLDYVAGSRFAKKMKSKYMMKIYQ